ncbi:MAG: UPF0280 family protein [Planctomycetota bacterium]|jgi:ApbE superfamily uncharacterized protein (UPF0280 family)
MFEPRTYRKFVTASGLETFEVRVEETDLQIAAERDLSGAALSAIHRVRGILKHFIEDHPKFETTLDPYPELHREWPHEIQNMIKAGRAAGTGPMSAVAGCISEYVGKALLAESDQVIVENGGDVFVASSEERILAVFAGDSPLSMQIGLKINPENTPIGICTSSGTVGHSLSLGMADAAIILAEQTALADAVATAAGNRVSKEKDIEPTLDWAFNIDGVRGAVLVVGETIGARGEIIELVNL